MKYYTVTTVSVERFRGHRYCWLYLHAIAPIADNDESAIRFAVDLRNCVDCRVESDAEGIDMTYVCNGFTFRFARDAILGTVIECDQRVYDRVKEVIAPFVEFAADV